mmetsp:Transcript_14394/g.43605  ORF Transcript_14394/g.43605 Transcript_14394/m.43605 type:complete len:117 (+) Transcript_14394:29-379(+)
MALLSRRKLLRLAAVVAVAAAGLRSCDYVCVGGRCEYGDCEDAACPGGVCTFYDSKRPSCAGGSCVFVRCHDPTCDGGSCQFNDTRTTLVDGYCDGGNCEVQGKRWPIKLQGGLSY